MKLKKTWIGTAICGLALITLLGMGVSGVRYSDDTKFTATGPTIGKSATEIINAIGVPARKAKCRVPLKATQRGSPTVEGEDWMYTYQGDMVKYELYLCIVKGTVVAEYRIAKTLKDNVSYSREDITIDYGLTARIVKNQEDTIAD